ncbi:unnamed protein product, partial [Meganyctiphanes norvegica]
KLMLIMFSAIRAVKVTSGRSYTGYKGEKYVGALLGSIESARHVACAQHCSAAGTSCPGFNMIKVDSNSFTCELMKVVIDIEDDAETTRYGYSYIGPIEKITSDKCEHLALDSPGVSVKECKKICDQNTACSAFNISPYICYLKNCSLPVIEPNDVQE